MAGWRFQAVGGAVGLLLLAQLGAGPAPSATPLAVVATTTIVGDVVRQIGSPWIELRVLLPFGADAHAFQPVPQDLAALAQAEVVFVNGFGLEAGLLQFLEDNVAPAKRVTVSQGVTPRSFQPGESAEAQAGQADPHVWFDPANVRVWADNVERALSAADPAHAPTYRANAELYRRWLGGLDGWIRDQVAQIPAQSRLLVSDHDVLGYFADRYGFRLLGAVLPGLSTAAEPSARELAALEDAIRQTGVRAVFVGASANPSLAQRVAEDTGVQLVVVYTGSLSAPGGPADTYLGLMRFNTEAIVAALREPGGM